MRHFHESFSLWDERQTAFVPTLAVEFQQVLSAV
jgi:hypothetical protein